MRGRQGARDDDSRSARARSLGGPERIPSDAADARPVAAHDAFLTFSVVENGAFALANSPEWLYSATAASPARISARHPEEPR